MPPDNPVMSGLDASAAAAVSPPASDTPKTPPPMDAATSASSLSSEVEKAAQENGIPSGIFHAQALRESHFNPTARSPKGAEGVMQLMPRTAAELGVNSDDPVENIHGGAKYMKKLHDQFGSWDKALAAYDWGPHNVHEASVAHGENWLDDAPDETKKYVKNILEHPVVGPVQTAPVAAITKDTPTISAAPHTLHERVGDWFHMPSDEYEKKYASDDAETSKKVDSVMQHLVPLYKQAEDTQKVIEGTKAGKQAANLVHDQLAHPEQLAMGGVEGPEGEISGAIEGLAKDILPAAEKSPQSGNLASIPGAIQVKAAPKIGALENVPGAIKIKPAGEHLPSNDYVYHATDKSRSASIEQNGLRPNTWFAHTPEDAMRSGAVPVSGNRHDLRVYAVPKAEIVPATPDAADIGAREVQKGRFVQSSAQHMPSHEVTSNGHVVQSLRPEPKTSPTSPQEAVEAAGGVFHGQNKDGLVEITLPRSMTDKLALEDRMKPFVSVTMPASEVTPEAVKAAMDAKFKQFGGKPE